MLFFAVCYSVPCATLTESHSQTKRYGVFAWLYLSFGGLLGFVVGDFAKGGGSTTLGASISRAQENAVSVPWSVCLNPTGTFAIMVNITREGKDSRHHFQNSS